LGAIDSSTADLSPAILPTLSSSGSPSLGAIPTILSTAPPSSSTTPLYNPFDDTNWRQAAYYDMDNGVAEGLTFLNDLGTHGSAYASADGATKATSAEVFGGELKSRREMAIFSSASCEGAVCEFYRPGSTAFRMMPYFHVHEDLANK
jgi:hypothetical protein